MASVRMLDVDLPPDIFAIVMATGILAVAAEDHEYRYLSLTFAGVASVIFVVLTVGLGLRILTRLQVIISQARDPDVALRMFTFVAAASVLGVVWREHRWAVWVLAVLATVGWLVLVPLGVRDVRSRPRAELRDHAHGAWLLVSVATSGMATTAADLGMIERHEYLVMVGVALWVVALLFYCAVTYFIAWRAISAPFRPSAVTPDSWILMGALAIATLAGAHLLQTADLLDRPGLLPEWLGPATLVVWAVASLWIPVLLYAEIWRVDRQAGSLRFSGVWWSAVFPLGMYASATAATGLQLGMPNLATISLVMFWISVTVWVLVAAGLLQFGVTRSRRTRAAGR